MPRSYHLVFTGNIRRSFQSLTAVAPELRSHVPRYIMNYRATEDACGQAQTMTLKQMTTVLVSE